MICFYMSHQSHFTADHSYFRLFSSRLVARDVQLLEQRRHGIQSRFCLGYRGSKSIYGEEKLFPIVRSQKYLSFVLFWERRFVDCPLKEWKWHRITRDPYLKPERFFLQSTSKRKSVKLTVSLHIWKIILWFYSKHFRFKLAKQSLAMLINSVS